MWALLKEVRFCHKLKILYPDILTTLCHKPLMFQTINSVGSKFEVKVEMSKVCTDRLQK